MIDICWRTYRRAFAALLASAGSLALAVLAGYTLAKVDTTPPASAVTPAQSGTGQLGRAPFRPLERTTPPTVKRSPRTKAPKKPRQPRKTSSPTPPASPTPVTSSTPPVSPTSEPAETVTPTP